MNRQTRLEAAIQEALEVLGDESQSSDERLWEVEQILADVMAE